MPTYEIWIHQHMHEFAVRIEEGHVTGVCSIPLHVACDPDGRLPDLEYDSSPVALFRFVEYPEQFFEFDSQLLGTSLPVRPQWISRCS